MLSGQTALVTFLAVAAHALHGQQRRHPAHLPDRELPARTLERDHRRQPVGRLPDKHGLVGLSNGVALETATQGVTVNCICPAWTDTASEAAAGITGVALPVKGGLTAQ